MRIQSYYEYGNTYKINTEIHTEKAANYCIRIYNVSADTANLVVNILEDTCYGLRNEKV
jgi:hypothetical protein